MLVVWIICEFDFRYLKFLIIEFKIYIRLILFCVRGWVEIKVLESESFFISCGSVSIRFKKYGLSECDIEFGLK